MKRCKEIAGILVVMGAVALNHGWPGLARADTKKAEAQPEQVPKGYYILEGRGDIMGRMATEFPPVTEVELIRVADGIYKVIGGGGDMNVGVCIGDDGVLLVDDSFPELTADIMAAIRKHTDKPVRFVVNTHWHWDHTGGNENMAKAGAVIIAQEDVMQWMTTWQISGMEGTPKAPQAPKGLPVITFKDKLTLRFNGHTIEVINVGPAHTTGDAIVRFVEKDIYFLGDIYLSQSYPYFDLNTGGNIKGFISALDKVLAKVRPDTIIVPGHGEVSNGAELKEYRDMVVTIRNRVKAAIDGGKTLDEIIAAKPTVDLDEKWSNMLMSPEVVLRFTHISLTGGAIR
jgi:glyoxylase-like metal-dependent hydrolase (beta-lactamase superfamily II)